MSSTVLDVVKVVVIGLHADLAICVLFVWDRLQQCGIVPVLNVVVGFDSFLQIFVIFSFSSFFNSVEVLVHKDLFSLRQARAVPIWRLFSEFMNIVLLPEPDLCLSLRVHSPIEVPQRRRFAIVLGFLDLFLRHGNLHVRFSWGKPRCVSCSRS